jgi:hypothetical protein
MLVTADGMTMLAVGDSTVAAAKGAGAIVYGTASFATSLSDKGGGATEVSSKGSEPLRAGEKGQARGLGGRVLTTAEQDQFATFGERAKAAGLTENPNRTGSWGRIGENGKFQEITRIDVGETGKPGFRGETHTHIEGQDGHLDPNTKIPGE